MHPTEEMQHPVEQSTPKMILTLLTLTKIVLISKNSEGLETLEKAGVLCKLRP
jgi:GTP cyclohydrolase II